MTLGVPTSPGVPAAAAADTLLARYNDLDVGGTAVRRASRARSPRCSSSRSPATWAWCRRATVSSQGLRELCDREGALLVFDEVISGFRAAAGRRAEDLRRQAGPDLPGQDHRRRAAGRRLRRPRRRDGAGRAGRPGLSGGHAVGQPAGDDRGVVVALAELSPGLYRHLAAAGQPAGRRAGGCGARRRRAAAGERVRLAADAVLHRPQPVRDYQSALTRATPPPTAGSSARCWRAASTRRRRSSRRGSCRARTREKDVDKTVKAAQDGR